MPNIALVLKAEIARISRKEARSETERLQTMVAQQRKELVALKRQVTALEKSLVQVLRSARKESAAVSPVSTQAAGGPTIKFSAAKLIKHRQLLGITANEYGALVGVTGQSIYKWEAGKAFPRSQQLERASALLAMGKREFLAMQAEMPA